MLPNMSISCIQYMRDATTDQRKVIIEGYHDNNRHNTYKTHNKLDWNNQHEQ